MVVLSNIIRCLQRTNIKMLFKDVEDPLLSIVSNALLKRLSYVCFQEIHWKMGKYVTNDKTLQTFEPCHVISA